VLVRMALMGSPVTEPITVATINRPAWLAAVADEPGVRVVESGDAPAALAAYW
jgi:hypothetical protein